MRESKNSYKSQITVNELSWKPTKDHKNILEKINITFDKGNIYGIIGPNGSGKTSFIKNLLHFVEPDKGNIMIEDVNLLDYRRKDLAKKIALVPQNTTMDSSFLVYDVVMMGRVPYQKRFAEASQSDIDIVTEAMILTDCYSFKDKEVDMLSGGEAQRVLTARAIAQDTEWLILDEPTASLDVKHQIELMESLVKLKKHKNKTIITVLHDINIAATYCNQIIMMKDGKVHSHGKTEEVLTKDKLREVYEINFEILDNMKNGKKYYIPYTCD
ncbi:iron ABC transporter ATP-binding protein [Anaeromicropila herbilytica]|uniref:Iron ABC transporter ATP-binding protein n=2 Tax=Anaeromicropila herbilytica TaxID=2785025 RepID=A0A7R7EHH2_9FIRM|nr:iron ABC transporter ATP-binding protein [Anaeromicropila herbilytica]